MNRKQRRYSIMDGPTPLDVMNEAERQGVDPLLALSIASNESAGNPNAVSRAGARGTMQLMPGTARRHARALGEQYNPNDPWQNVRLGVRELADLSGQFDSYDEIAAGYNAGPGAVRQHRGIPPYRETQGYVPRVRQTYKALERQLQNNSFPPSSDSAMVGSSSEGVASPAQAPSLPPSGNILNLGPAQEAIAQQEMPRLLGRRSLGLDQNAVSDIGRAAQFSLDQWLSENRPQTSDVRPQSSSSILHPSSLISQSRMPESELPEIGDAVPEPGIDAKFGELRRDVPLSPGGLGNTGKVHSVTLPPGVPQTEETLKTGFASAFLKENSWAKPEAVQGVLDNNLMVLRDVSPDMWQTSFNRKTGGYDVPLTVGPEFAEIVKAYQVGGLDAARIVADQVRQQNAKRAADFANVQTQMTRASKLGEQIAPGGGVLGGLEAANYGNVGVLVDAAAGLAGLPQQISSIAQGKEYNLNDEPVWLQNLRQLGAAAHAAAGKEVAGARPFDFTDLSTYADLPRRYAGTIGSTVPFLLGSIASGGGTAGLATIGAIGAGSQSAQGYADALAHGATPEQVRDSALLNAPLGAMEAFGGQAGAVAGGLKRGAWREIAHEIRHEGIGEFLQEGGTQFGGNVIAKDIVGYDPNRARSEGVLENAIVGGVLGGVTGGAMGTAGKVVEHAPDIRDGVLRLVDRVRNLPPDVRAQANQAATVTPETQAQQQQIFQAIVRQHAAKLSELEQQAGPLMRIVQQGQEAQQRDAQMTAQGYVPVNGRAVQAGQAAQEQLSQLQLQAQTIIQQSQQQAADVAGNIRTVQGLKAMHNAGLLTAGENVDSETLDLLEGLTQARDDARRRERQTVFDNGAAKPTPDESVDLLKEVRKEGGIGADSDVGGELRRLGAKESQTTGIINQKSGLPVDEMRLRMRSEGLTQADTVDDFVQELDDAIARRVQRRNQREDDLWSEQAWNAHAEKWVDDQAEYERLRQTLDGNDIAQALLQKVYEGRENHDERTRLYDYLVKYAGEPAANGFFLDLGKSGVARRNTNDTQARADQPTRRGGSAATTLRGKPATGESFGSEFGNGEPTPYQRLANAFRDEIPRLYDLDLRSNEAQTILNDMRRFAGEDQIALKHVGALIDSVRNYQMDEARTADSRAAYQRKYAREQRRIVGNEEPTNPPDLIEAPEDWFDAADPESWPPIQRVLSPAERDAMFARMQPQELDSAIQALETLRNNDIKGKVRLDPDERIALHADLDAANAERKARVKRKEMGAKNQSMRVDPEKVAERRKANELLAERKARRVVNRDVAGMSEAQLSKLIADGERIETALADDRAYQGSPRQRERVAAMGRWRAELAQRQAAAIDQAAHEAATSPQNDLPEPTEAQKEAGNLGPLERVAQVNQSIRDRILADAKLFGDSADAQSVIAQGFQSLNRDAQHVMLSHVVGALDDDQVFRAIVQSVPIDVMDLLVGGQGATKNLFHDKTVLAHRLTVPRNVPILEPVVRFMDTLASVVGRVSAGLGTEKTSLSDTGTPASGEFGPAVITSKSPARAKTTPTGNRTEDATGGSLNNPVKSGFTGVTNVSSDGRHIHSDVIDGKPVYVDINPTDAQKEAGNYLHGAIKLHGLDISIENPKGSTRSGTGADGKPWSVEMSAHYGYIRRSESADGEQMDVYIGPKPESDRVFVVDQVDADTGQFDEHKVILGAESLTEAQKLYDAHFDDSKGPQRRGAVTEMSLPRFKEWLKSEDSTKPLAYQETKPITKEVSETPQPVQPVADAGNNLPYMKVVKQRHTKKNKDIYIVTLAKEVERDVFDGLRKEVEGRGGWYSRAWGRSPRGFAFNTEAEAQAFVDEKKGKEATKPEASAPVTKDAAIKPTYTAEKDYRWGDYTMRAHSDGEHVAIRAHYKDATYETTFLLSEADGTGRFNKEIAKKLGLPLPKATWAQDSVLNGIGNLAFDLKRQIDQAQSQDVFQEMETALLEMPSIQNAAAYSDNQNLMIQIQADVSKLKGRLMHEAAKAKDVPRAKALSKVDLDDLADAVMVQAQRAAEKKPKPKDEYNPFAKLASDWVGRRIKTDDGTGTIEAVEPTRPGSVNPIVYVRMDSNGERYGFSVQAVKLALWHEANAAPAESVATQPTPQPEVAQPVSQPTATQPGLADVSSEREILIRAHALVAEIERYEDESRTGDSYAIREKLTPERRETSRKLHENARTRLQKIYDEHFDLLARQPAHAPGNLKEVQNALGKPVRPSSLLPEVEPKEVKAFRQLADAIYVELAEGRKLDNRKLQQLADPLFGGTPMSGAYTLKDAYDATELAVNYWINERAKTLMRAEPATVFEQLRKLMSQLPTQRSDARTKEQQDLQQFSTPPQLAYLAAKVLNANPNDLVVEPSAGTGSLAVFARGTGAEVHTNEISERRREALKRLGFSVTGADAEFLNSTLPAHIQPSAVLMNPPFSSTGDRGLTNSSKYGARHVEEALLRLQPGGRLVAIVSDGMGMDRPKLLEWWQKVASRYNVRADVSLSGQEYAKYGTTYDNRILVIEKTGPTPGATYADRMENVLRGRFDRIEDAYAALQTIAQDRPAIERASETSTTANVQPAKPAEQPAPAMESGNEPAVRGARDSAATSGSRSSSTGTGRSGSDVAAPGATRSGESVATVPGDQPRNTVAKGAESVQRGSGSTADDESGRVDFGANDALAGRKEEAGGTFVEYVPAKVRGGGKHPAPIVEAASMAAIEPPTPTYQPNLPKQTIEKGLSNVQLETVVYAGQRHESKTPAGARAGYFIGDGTGVGKGRQISAIILDNWRQGRRRAVWFSTGTQLQESAQRDLNGVGAKDIPLYLIHDYASGEPLDAGDGVMFATYSMLIGKSNDKEKISRFEQLKQWLGPDGVIVFDEGHKAKNAIGAQGEGTQTGVAVINLQRALPNARVVYASATGATDVRNMAYMDRLGMWGPGTAFPDGFEGFWREIEAGGVGAMEMVARDMKAIGAYASRSISYGVDPESGLGVEYNKHEHVLSEGQREIYDGAARAWTEVSKRIEEAVVQTNGGSRQKSRAMSVYYSAQQRFFKALITAAKVPTAIEIAEKAVEQGKQVVISLIGTGEAQQDRVVRAATASGTDLEDMDFSPREVLYNYIDRSFPVEQYKEVRDAQGNKSLARVTDEQGNPVPNAEAVRMREELKSMVSGLVLPESPLDQIINHFEAQKIGVAELTGRKKRLMRDPKTGKVSLQKRAPVPAKKINEYEMEQFQAGKKPVAVISQAAAEGISLHADKDSPTRNKRRVQITLELDWSADKQMQTFGRTHRTNQTMPPEFVLLSSNVGGEARFISTIARRLSSLGALTKGQRDAAGAGSDFADFNFETAEGEAATGHTLQMLQGGNVPGARNGNEILEEMGLLDGDKQIKREALGDVTKFLNRVLAQPLERQNAIFDYFAQSYQRIVEQRKASGMFDAGVTDLKAQRIERKGAPVDVYTDKRSGARTQAHTLELEYPTYIHRFNEAMQHFTANVAEDAKFARNRKTDKVALLLPSKNKTDAATGAVKKSFSVSYPDRWRDNYIDADQVEKNWEVLHPTVARAPWEAQADAAPKVTNEDTVIFAGALLPIWQHLKGDKDGELLRIVRVQLDNGERLVGVQMRPGRANRVLRSLGLESQRRTPAEIFEAVRKGENVSLMNGLMLGKIRVRGEDAIQVLGVKRGQERTFRDIGLIEVKNFSNSQFYVPTDAEKGVEVLGRLLGTFPEMVEARTEGPAASRRNVPRLSELSNPLDSLKYATLNAKVATKSKPARFYTNEHGMAVLTTVASKIFKQDYIGTDGLTFTRQQLTRLVAGLRQSKDATLRGLADTLDATIAAHPDQKAFWLVDTTDLTAEGFERWEASARFKATAREERFHWSQVEIDGQGIALTGKTWAERNVPAKIKRALTEAGYPDDPEILAAETAAKIAADKLQELGIRTDADVEAAQRWLVKYFERVVERHGEEALLKFGSLRPGVDAARREAIENGRDTRLVSERDKVARAAEAGERRGSGELGERSGTVPRGTDRTGRRQGQGESRIPEKADPGEVEAFEARGIPKETLKGHQPSLGEPFQPEVRPDFDADFDRYGSIRGRQQSVPFEREERTEATNFNTGPMPTAQASLPDEPRTVKPGYVGISEAEIQRWRKETKAAVSGLKASKRLTPELEAKIKPILAAAERAIQANDGVELVRQRQAMVKALESNPTLRSRFLDLLNLPKTFKASFDLSYPFRQGAIGNLNLLNLFDRGRMRDRAREWKVMLSSIRKGSFERFEAELRNHPYYDLAERAGLHLVSREAYKIGADILAREESFTSRIAQRIPGVGVSERTYTAAADMQRIQLFAQFATELERAGLTSELNPEAYEDIAGLVNNMTGRGSLPKFFESLAPILNGVMFSPRYLASRVRLMNPAYYASLSKPARRIAMREMAGFLGAVATIAGGAAALGASVGLDPDDSDFMKIRVGNTRYDLLAGMGQVGVFAFRVIKLLYKNARHQDDKRTVGQVAERFARTKASPAGAYFYDWLVRDANFVGGGWDTKNPFNHSKAAKDLLIPIMFTDFQEALQQEGWKGVVKTAPAAVGVGVQTYQPRPASAKQLTRRKSSAVPKLPKVKPLVRQMRLQ